MRLSPIWVAACNEPVGRATLVRVKRGIMRFANGGRKRIPSSANGTHRNSGRAALPKHQSAGGAAGVVILLKGKQRVKVRRQLQEALSLELLT